MDCMTDVNATGRTVRHRIALWTMAGLALLVSHDAVYLAQVGPGESLTALLRTAGHGYWGVASSALVVLAVLVAAAAAVRILRLRRRAAELGAQPAQHARPWGTFVRSWTVLAVLVATAFAVQENLEHLAAHGHAPGIGALLGPEYPLALPVIALVTGIAAAIAALVARHHEALVAAIGAVLRSPARPVRVPLRPSVRIVAPTASVMARPGAGRAPPSVLAPAR
jgi:hypothetical protein